jgi:hypothetical protein
MKRGLFMVIAPLALASSVATMGCGSSSSASVPSVDGGTDALPSPEGGSSDAGNADARPTDGGDAGPCRFDTSHFGDGCTFAP